MVSWTSCIFSIWRVINAYSGVPQGPARGPLLFIIYKSPLGQIPCTLGIQIHIYADDSHIYVTFNADEAESTVTKIEESVATVKQNVYA